jgi:hypothetical protein
MAVPNGGNKCFPVVMMAWWVAVFLLAMAYYFNVLIFDFVSPYLALYPVEKLTSRGFENPKSHLGIAAWIIAAAISAIAARGADIEQLARPKWRSTQLFFIVMGTTLAIPLLKSWVGPVACAFHMATLGYFSRFTPGTLPIPRSSRRRAEKGEKRGRP